MMLLLLACAQIKSESCAACDAGCVQESLPNRGADHVSGDVDYEDAPPASGDHWACWAPWGTADAEVPPEQWVHNLEHGGVVFLYNCPDGCDADVATLTDFVNALPTGRALLSSYTEMDSSFAAVAWQERLLLDCLDTDALWDFFEAHVGQAPEDVTSDPSESCEM